ncbi:unnamed protein product, partial [Ixodes persulcatus]
GTPSRLLPVRTQPNLSQLRRGARLPQENSRHAHRVYVHTQMRHLRRQSLHRRKECKDRYKPLPEPRSPKKSTPEQDRETAKIDMGKKNFPELSNVTTAGEDSEEELSYAQTLRKKKGASKKKQDSNPRIKELEKKYEDLVRKH